MRPLLPPYSYRSASAIGTDEALRAGIQVISPAATSDAAMKNVITPHGAVKPLKPESLMPTHSSLALTTISPT